jgi:hypothetical protein
MQFYQESNSIENYVAALALPGADGTAVLNNVHKTDDPQSITYCLTIIHVQAVMFIF